MLDSYRQGYLKALMDVKDYLDYHSESLKHNRAFNSKKIPLLCQAFIDYHEVMMTYGGSELELILTKEGKVILDESARH